MDAREVQDFVDELSHPLGSVSHPQQVALAAFIELVVIIFQQCLAEAIDASERCTKIVGHRVRKRFEFPVRGFELGSAVMHALLEFKVELAEIFFSPFPLLNFSLHGRVDPLSLGRIEVVKGPGSVMYGSDAVGGVLSAMTKGPFEFGDGFLYGGLLAYRWSSAERSNVGRAEAWATWERKLGIYLGGSAKYSTEDRLKMIAAAQRMVCSHESSFHEVTTVHAEGSMAAQKMMILFESPLKRYKEMAKRAAGVIA